MRLRRTPDGEALPGAGFDAFACALLAMTRIIVGWTKVRQAVVVAWAHVVDRVGAGKAAEVADVPVEGVDLGLGAAGGLPVAGEASTTVRILPPAGRHGWASLEGAEVGGTVLVVLDDGRRIGGVVTKVQSGELTIESSRLP